MKLGSPFWILLTITFVFACVALIINEMNVNYPEAGVQNSTLMTEFNYSYQMNESFTKMSDAAGKVGTAEGFWEKSIGSAMVLWQGLIITLTSLISSIPLFGTILASIGVDLGIPQSIVMIAYIAVLGAIIVMIIKFWHRGE